MATINKFVALLSAAELKALVSTINNNISDDYIGTSIEIEQKKSIRPMVGYSLYNEIQTQFSGDTLSVANEIIYDDYIKMILAYSVYKRLIVDMTYQLENAGLRKKFSDVSEVAEQSEMTYVRNQIQNDLDFYKTELIKYINENQSDYPLYFNDTDSRNNNLDDRRTKGFNLGMNMSDTTIGGCGFISKI